MNFNDYEAARQAAVYYLLDHPGYLRFSGPDRANFLQRQTTNDIRLLNPGRVLQSVLTSPTARILDVFYLFQEQDAIGCISLPARSTETARFLTSRIFFMDKVSILDASPDFAQIDLEGPQAGAILDSIGVQKPEGLNTICQTEINHQPLHIFSKPGLLGTGYRLMISSAGSKDVQEMLTSAGARPLSLESHQILRVEAGLPGEAGELNESLTPLEVNLIDAIAEDKGCYTGQEILARQINYDKITRSLQGLRLPVYAPPGISLLAEGKPAGTITSAVESPRLGPIALAVLKRPYNQPGIIVEAQLDGERIEGQVSGLPFP